MKVRYVAGSKSREEMVDRTLDKLEGRKQIIFRDIDNLYQAQIIFSRLHIQAYTSGLSLYVPDSQEYQALNFLRLAGIKVIEPEQMPICKECNKPIDTTKWIGPGDYWHKECRPNILPEIVKVLQETYLSILDDLV